MGNGLARHCVTKRDHAPHRTVLLKKEAAFRPNIEEGGSGGESMANSVGAMTGLLGVYLTFKMWVEFQDALGTVFGASWAIIISTLVFLIYQSNKNDKAYEASFGQVTSGPREIKKQFESDNQPPLLFIGGLYAFIVVVFEILLGAL
jgi:hypothetical protein